MIAISPLAVSGYRKKEVSGIPSGEVSVIFVGAASGRDFVPPD